MISLVRRIAPLCALVAALAACGASDAPRPVQLETIPSGVASAPPPLVPGPGGLTPVFKRATTHEKIVALTFDADMTADDESRAAAGERFDNPGLIDALRALKVPATVFMTGRWADAYPAQARSIGHDPLFEVANHSYSHYAFIRGCFGMPALPEDRMRADVEHADTAIRRAGVPRPMPYFRFPGGCYDNDALRVIGSLGLTAVQWDVPSGDAFAVDARTVVRQVLDGVRPGSVVVMHCTRAGAPLTEQVVRTVVPQLRARGYRFTKVSQSIAASAGRA
ncbi:polysaccharide deacetylase family protein [Streptomyces sp. NPDC052051]|uniref:polysaccharide deacetylase family protein n=1 Tax=Streptomyces sp. NPDC052051 TaxID=3154649 RepID=UPI0034461464